MKKTFIDIRDSEQNCKVVKTLIFKGDVSVIVTDKNRFMVIELENDQKTTTFEIKNTERFSMRNWG